MESHRNGRARRPGYIEPGWLVGRLVRPLLWDSMIAMGLQSSDNSISIRSTTFHLLTSRQSFLNPCTHPDRTIDRRIIGQHSFDHTAHHPTTRSHTFTYHKILTQSIIPQQSHRNHGIPVQSVNKTAGEYRTRGGADKPT